MPLLLLFISFLLTGCDTEDQNLYHEDQNSHHEDQNLYHWNVWLYLGGDNDLHESILYDVEEITAGSRSNKINICLQIDLHEQNAERYCIRNGNKSSVQNIGEVDMTQKQTLSEFIKWAEQQGRSKYAMLILSDHGNGWDHKVGPSPRSKISNQSMFVDYDNDSPSTPSLHNHLIADAIADSNVEFDILGFDASIMGSIEVLTEFSDNAEILITSQEVGYADGWNYEDIFTQLSANTSMGPETLATLIVESYEEYYETNDIPKVYSIAAHRSSSIIPLATEIDNIANNFIEKLQNSPEATVKLLKASRENAQAIDPIIQADVYVDLKDFLIQADLYNDNISAILEEATISEYHGNERPNANGISIVFFKAPTAKPEDNCKDPITQSTDWACVRFDSNYTNWDDEAGTGNKGRFINDYSWDELLHDYYASINNLN